MRSITVSMEIVGHEPESDSEKEVPIMGNWLEERLKSASDEELFGIFMEIAEFHREGVLRPGAKLRDIERGYRAVLCTTSALLRTVEDQALFEMSRRFSTGVESGEHC